MMAIQPKTQHDEIRVLAPTGVLGAGFDADAFARGVAMQPHVIACDAGSTDSGPSALGSGRAKPSDDAVRRDLRLLLTARNELDVPLIVGSCGTSGRDVGVDAVAAQVRTIAAERGFHLKLGLVYSDQDGQRLQQLWEAGRIRALPFAPPIENDTFEASTVVAMMGVEPIQEHLKAGCDVILVGRASDTALFAALPQLLGADPGLNWHAAKTIECGAACAIPPSANGLLARIGPDHFTVETLAEGTRLTPRSVAAHTLYENADPFRIIEPSGVLDATNARYEEVDERTVRVSGAVYEPADDYSIKLEGARLVGYQTVIIGGVRDRIVIDRLPHLIPMAQKYFADRILDVFEGRIDPDDIDISFRLYGNDAVLGAFEPDGSSGKELGVLITITAPEQDTAHKIASFVAHVSSHLPIDEYDGLVSTLAYPFSPPEIDRGPLYRFTLNHVVVPIDPHALFRTSTEDL